LNSIGKYRIIFEDMSKKGRQLDLIPRDLSSQRRSLQFNRGRFLEWLDKIEQEKELRGFRSHLFSFYQALQDSKIDPELYYFKDGELVEYQSETLFSQIEQMLEARTLERAKYYLKRLKRSLTESRPSPWSDLDLNRWQDYPEIITDSLWLFDRRDTSGAHLAWYWGNFIPQIPRQLIWRFTKKGEWVLDPFVGSGTTLIECRRLRRNGVGIEINSEVVEKAKELVAREPNPGKVRTEIFVGDAKEFDYQRLLSRFKIKSFQLAILHPPYHDIIKFSNLKDDLSNASSIEQFLNGFGKVVENLTPYLDTGRFLAVVIGDKYQKGEWIPLGFYCLEEVRKRGYKLKSIVVKNFEDTRAKRNQKELWRYRALVGGFYVFKHEYILIFQKIKR